MANQENLTIDDIRKAIEFLKKNGSKISHRAIYDYLKRGSFTTITKLLKKIQEEELEAEKSKIYTEVGSELIDALAVEIAKAAYQCKYEKYNEVKERNDAIISNLVENNNMLSEEFSATIDEQKEVIAKLELGIKEKEKQLANLNQEIEELKKQINNKSIVLTEKEKQLTVLQSLIVDKLNEKALENTNALTSNESQN